MNKLHVMYSLLYYFISLYQSFKFRRQNPKQLSLKDTQVSLI